MPDEHKIALWKIYWQLPVGQKFTIVGLAIGAGILGWGANEFRMGYKIDKIEFEKTSYENKIKKLESQQTIGINQIAVDREVFSSLQSRPKECPISECQLDSRSATSLEMQNCPPISCESKTTSEKLPFDKTCVTEDNPQIISSRFEAYNSSRNEKIFNDHYSDKWVCENGWSMEIYRLPEKVSGGYWELTGFSRSDGKSSIITAKLQYGVSVNGLSKGDVVEVNGRITRAGENGITLSDASFVRK